jgi:hypothetical protein
MSDLSSDGSGASSAAVSGDPAGRRRRRGLVFRWVSVVLALALLAALPFVIAPLTEALLASERGRQWVNRRPERFQMTYESASSTLPGKVRFEGVLLRGQTNRTSWEFEADELEAQISLPSLLVKIFEMESIRGSGVRFSFVRLDAAKESATGVAPLVPLQEEVSPPTRSPSARPWTIDLEDIELEDVRQVWFDRERLELGEGSRFDGSMRFALHRYVEIDGAQLEVIQGELFEADELILTGAMGLLKLDLAPLRAREADLEEIVRALSGRVRFDAEIGELGVLGQSFDSLAWLDLDASGRIEVDLGLQRGSAVAGSFVRVRSQQVQVVALGQEITGSGTLVARFERPEALPLGSSQGPEALTAARAPIDIEVDVGLDQFRGRPSPKGGASSSEAFGGVAFEGRGLEVHLVGQWRRLTRPPEFVGGELRLADAELRDLSALQRYIPETSGLELSSGSARLDVDVRFDGALGAGRSSIQGGNLSFRLQGVPMRTDLDLALELAEIDLSRRRAKIDGTTLQVDALRVVGSDAPTSPWWGRATLPKATVEFSPGGPLFTATFVGRMRDSRPLVSYYTRDRRLLKPLTELLTVQGLKTDGRLYFGPSRGTVECFEATAEKLSILADLSLGSGRREGIALFEYGNFALGLEAEAAQRDWKLLRPRRWFREQRGSLCTN